MQSVFFIFTPMNLEQNIMNRLKEAMKAKDEVALRTLRAIKAAILVEKTAEAAKESLSPEDEIKLLTKMAKQRKDSQQIFIDQNRSDLAVKEEEELKVIEEFLPKQLSSDELTQSVKKIISQVNATGPQDMGKVMGLASKTLTGKADGSSIAAEVKKQLSSL